MDVVVVVLFIPYNMRGSIANAVGMKGRMCCRWQRGWGWLELVADNQKRYSGGLCPGRGGGGWGDG